MTKKKKKKYVINTKTYNPIEGQIIQSKKFERPLPSNWEINKRCWKYSTKENTEIDNGHTKKYSEGNSSSATVGSHHTSSWWMNLRLIGCVEDNKNW